MEWISLLSSAISNVLTKQCMFSVKNLKKRSKLSKRSARENFSYLLFGARQGAEQDQLPCVSTRTPASNCQETETCMVQACHKPRLPVQNYPSGHLEGWATPWSADEMLDRHHQRVDVSAYARTAHKGFLQKRLEEDLCWIVPQVPPTTQSVKGLN